MGAASFITSFATSSFRPLVLRRAPPQTLACATLRFSLLGWRLAPQDDGQTLAQAGITPTSRVLVTKGAATSGALAAQEERTRRLEKLRRVMAAMAARSGRGLGEEYEFSLVNQAGQVSLWPKGHKAPLRVQQQRRAVMLTMGAAILFIRFHINSTFHVLGAQAMQLSEGDRKALVAGLALADKGKASLEAGDYAGALGELLMADEAFSLCEPATLEAVDNPALLQLDIVSASNHWAGSPVSSPAPTGIPSSSFGRFSSAFCLIKDLAWLGHRCGRAGS